MDLRELLATPAVATILGLLLGVVLLAPILLGYRFLRADKIDVGIGVVVGGVLFGMLFALGALFGYRAITPTGIYWFGPSMVVGFVIGLGAVSLYAAREMLKSD